MFDARIFVARHLHRVLVLCAAAMVSAIAALPIDEQSVPVPRIEQRKENPPQLDTFAVMTRSSVPFGQFGSLPAPSWEWDFRGHDTQFGARDCVRRILDPSRFVSVHASEGFKALSGSATEWE